MRGRTDTTATFRLTSRLVFEVFFPLSHNLPVSVITYSKSTIWHSNHDQSL